MPHERPPALSAHLETVRAAGVNAFRVDEETGCWPWTGALNKAGYPYSYAYRRAWEAVNGPRPDGFDMHHECKNRACVNPEHLRAISRREHDEIHFLNERAGIDIDQLRAIRAAGRVPGSQAQEVADRFGVSERTVRYYWSGTRWADLLGEEGRVAPSRVCPRCGDTLAQSKHRQAIYCTKRCQVLSKDSKRKAAA